MSKCAVVRRLGVLGLACLLAACASPAAHVGIGVPVGPVQVGVGVGTGGVSAGASVGAGPVGVGVGVNQRGQVTGNAGVGVSTSVGKARVGGGVGSSAVLYDPSRPAPAAAPAAQGGQPTLRWRDAQGRIVPECKVLGGC